MSVMVSVPLYAPGVVGANVTLIVQLPPDGKVVVVPHVPGFVVDRLKPVPETTTVKPPGNDGFSDGLVTVTVLVVVVATAPNDSGP